MSQRQSIKIIIIFLLCSAIAQSFAENSSEENAKTYYADHIKDLIKSGRDISCNDAIIIGDLNLSGLNLSTNSNSLKIIDSSINIINSEIKGDVEFGNAFFKKPVAFDKTTFSGDDVIFRISEFAEDLAFSDAEFKCPADFSRAKIEKGMTFIKTVWTDRAGFEGIKANESASFRNSKFQGISSFKDALMNGYVDFENSRFDQEASFKGSVFEDTANFLNTRFADLTEFEGAEFCGQANFARSRFDEIADFSSSHFIGSATFYYAKFANTAIFSDAKFGGIAEFRRCGFEGFADFSSADFLGNSRFEDAQFNKAVKFTNSNFINNTSFYETYFDRDAYFEGSRFESKLNLTNATFSRLALPWNAINGHIEYNTATHLDLINNYKNIGWTQDYRDCYYSYMEKKRTSEPFGYAKVMDTISWFYWGYGTKMYNPIAFIISSALIFALIYYGLVRFKWAEAVNKSNQPGCKICPWAKTERDVKSELSFKKALIFSMRIILPIEKKDDFEIKYAHIGKIIWIEIAVFGFLAANFVNYLLSEVQSHFKPP
ncbi:Pentapeptide repeats (9 copies) [uncultured archaeon]|nr:Pentapeptide repeats (9 copies) [uncultured archaeon]